MKMDFAWDISTENGEVNVFVNEANIVLMSLRFISHSTVFFSYLLSWFSYLLFYCSQRHEPFEPIEIKIIIFSHYMPEILRPSIQPVLFFIHRQRMKSKIDTPVRFRLNR